MYTYITQLSSNIRCLSGGDWDSEFLQCDFSPASVCPRVPRSRDVQYGCANYDMNHDVNYNVGKYNVELVCIAR